MSSQRTVFWRLRRHIAARPRLFASVCVGVIALALAPDELKPSSRALLAWLSGAGLYLALAWIMMWRSTVQHMKWHVRVQDDGAGFILVVTVAAAIASLAAIAIELHDLKSLSTAVQGAHVALVIATFAVSWLVTHSAFALHYAHEYYSTLGAERTAPLDFQNQAAPIYTDFLYFSMVIGMTSQTADVVISSSGMRRIVMVHGIIAFIFNTTLLALTINMVAGVLG